MKDLNIITSLPGGWHALLNFLAGIRENESIHQVEITREKARSWKVEIRHAIGEKKNSPNPKAGLYDLYW